MRDFLTSLSNNIHYVGIVLAGTAIGAKVLFWDEALLTILAVGAVVVGVGVFAWSALRRHRARKAEKSLAEQLGGNASATPGGVTDTELRAKLDDLRENFRKGLEKFKSAGKSIYNLPWYMVVGEPGSGKTEAVRRSNVGFPPGLQDEMQGSGGTINMHWWFTNQAVLLDTAGKLLFADTPAGTATEWTEFLNLLRKNRPNCPVNGLLLVIPADTLLRDSAEEITRKAGKIARQLDTIQRTLDVRFPVFVVLSKCDLLNGFREFFANVSDPALQHQMTGWSNPATLDAPFNTEAVEEHFATLQQTIARKRLGLMLNPAPVGDAARRADEVDALYTLPASIAALMPGLRAYLSTVFTAGAWSAKPLFLRGIYLTSALTEGRALDLELAAALGVAPDALPQGKLFERERSFFLRDLFARKIFAEKGLVTRATNAAGIVRRRHLAVGATAAAFFALVSGLSIYGSFAVRRSVGAERDYWRAAAANWRKDHTWNPVVSPEYRGASRFVLNTAATVDVGGEKVPLVEFHARLKDIVARDLDVPLVFAPFNALLVGVNSIRREAAAAVLDASVTRPLLDAARLRMGDTAAAWDARNDTAALATLFQLEGVIHHRSPVPVRVEFDKGAFIPPLLRLWSADDTAARTLDDVFQWTAYSENGGGRGKWPGKTLSAGRSLRENPPLKTGAERFLKSKAGVVAQRTDAAASLAATLAAARKWQTGEKAFLAAAARPATTPGWRADAVRTGAAATDAGAELAATVEAARAAKALPAEDARCSVAAATKAAFADAAAAIATEVAPLRNVADKFRPPAILGEAAGAAAGMLQSRFPAAATKAPLDALASETAKRATYSPNFPMLQEVSALLEQLDAEVAARIAAALGEPGAETLARLDTDCFDAPGGEALWKTRHAAYRGLLAPYAIPDSLAATLVGNLAKSLSENTAANNSAAFTAQSYERARPLGIEYHAAIKNLVADGAAASTAQILELHEKTVAARLAADARFPLARDATATLTTEAALELARFTQDARRDFDDTTSAVPPARRDARARAAATTAAAATVLDALVKPDGKPASVKILLPTLDTQREILARARVGDFSKNFAGSLWRTIRMGGTPVRTHTQAQPAGAREEDYLHTARVTDKLPALELFRSVDAIGAPDASHVFDSPWSSLRLLFQPGALRKGNGDTWLACLPIQDPDNNAAAAAAAPTPTAGDATTATAATAAPANAAAVGDAKVFLAMQFQYERPLPEPDSWPTVESLGGAKK